MQKDGKLLKLKTKQTNVAAVDDEVGLVSGDDTRDQIGRRLGVGDTHVSVPACACI